MFTCDGSPGNHRLVSNKLGFYDPWLWGEPPSDAGLWRDDLRLIFGQGKPYQGLEVMIFVDNVDEVFEELKAKGIPIAEGLSNEPYGIREFCIQDPNGYRLRIGETIST